MSEKIEKTYLQRNEISIDEIVDKEITPIEEKETVWSKSVYTYGDVYEMYTTDKVDMQRAIKLAKKYPNDVKIVKDDKYGMTFTFSMTGGTLAWRPKQNRPMTEEQRQLYADRLRENLKNKTSQN